ncbi:MAG: DUF4143 domain-containing protein [Fibrobacterota bacterium]
MARPGSPLAFEKLALTGFYPRIHAAKLKPTPIYRDYLSLYVERDLRQIFELKNLRQFEIFLRLCAGRMGQLFNASALASEVGVSVHTIQEWLSILEASFLVFLLQPWHSNIGKRLVKSPKLYFYDTGLAACLLGFESAEQIARDPLRGAIFENLVVADIRKNLFHTDREPFLHFYRDSNGSEVDLIVRIQGKLVPVEIKSASTYHPDFFKGLVNFQKVCPESAKEGWIVYNGTPEVNVRGHRLVRWANAADRILS